MDNKLLTVLIGGGYSPKLGFPEYTIQLPDGRFLFEAIMDSVPSKYVCIITNKSNIDWWDKWLQMRSPVSKKVTILFEPHSKPEDKIGPLVYLTTEVPKLFINFPIENVVVSSMDSYFDKFDFAKKLIKRKHALVINQLTLEEAKTKGVVVFNKDTEIVTSFEEKPVNPKSDWVFTGIFKTSLKNLQSLGSLHYNNYGDIIPELMRLNKMKAVIHDGLYWDIGLSETYNYLTGEQRIWKGETD